MFYLFKAKITKSTMKKLIIGLFAMVLMAGCQSHDQEGEHAHNPDGSHVTRRICTRTPGVYPLHQQNRAFCGIQTLGGGNRKPFCCTLHYIGDLFKAIGKGTIKLSLVAENARQSITATEPEVPGIFRLRMTPEKAGELPTGF
jgi:hypothetical protein